MSSTVETTLRRTPLYDRHVAAGARLVPFAGWEMPVQYEGIRQEHLAVRRDAGVFDVSHMGQVETRGPQALEFLQRMLSNDVRRIPEGGAQYSVMCREDGGVLDDLFTYRLADCEFLTVTNAANHDKDVAWLQAHAADFDVDVIDVAATVRDARRPGPGRARARRAARRRPAAAADALLRARPWRARRCSSAAPATPARTASSCCSIPATPPPSGTRSSPPARRPPGWRRATRSGSRSAFTFTATT